MSRFEARRDPREPSSALIVDNFEEGGDWIVAKVWAAPKTPDLPERIAALLNSDPQSLRDVGDDYERMIRDAIEKLTALLPGAKK